MYFILKHEKRVTVKLFLWFVIDTNLAPKSLIDEPLMCLMTRVAWKRNDRGRIRVSTCDHGRPQKFFQRGGGQKYQHLKKYEKSTIFRRAEDAN